MSEVLFWHALVDVMALFQDPKDLVCYFSVSGVGHKLQLGLFTTDNL